MTVIRPFRGDDAPHWQTLWQMNTQGQIPDTVTKTTWNRVLSEKDPVYGLGLWDGVILCGFLHYILHPITGAIAPACYMQDLFVHPDHRRMGYAKRLVWELGDIAQKSGWARVYWVSDRGDKPAQMLYKNLGIPVNFTLHFLPLQRD